MSDSTPSLEAEAVGLLRRLDAAFAPDLEFERGTPPLRAEVLALIARYDRGQARGRDGGEALEPIPPGQPVTLTLDQFRQLLHNSKSPCNEACERGCTGSRDPKHLSCYMFIGPYIGPVVHAPIQEGPAAERFARSFYAWQVSKDPDLCPGVFDSLADEEQREMVADAAEVLDLALAAARAVEGPADPVNAALAGLRAMTVDLDPVAQKVLRENLWDLYTSTGPVEGPADAGLVDALREAVAELEGWTAVHGSNGAQHDQLVRLRKVLYAARARVPAAQPVDRDAVLEEAAAAAVMVDLWERRPSMSIGKYSMEQVPAVCAAAIRSLKSTAPKEDR